MACVGEGIVRVQSVDPWFDGMHNGRSILSAGSLVLPEPMNKPDPCGTSSVIVFGS